MQLAEAVQIALTSMIATACDSAVNETYEDVRLLVYRIVHKFAACYGFTFDDLITHAHLAYVKAYEAYTTSKPAPGKKKAKFSSFMYFWVTTDLITYVNKEKRHRHNELEESMVEGYTPDARPFLEQLEEELSEDASLVVRLVLDTPEEFSATCHWCAAKNPIGMRRSVSEYLKNHGWARERIEEAFLEIRQIIS
jgi:DNA-directed RNA polymerase specialized sigma24 family protein